MGFSESIKIVCDRVEKLEPENAIMIIGYLLLLIQGQQIHNLAQSSDKFFQEVVSKAKTGVWQLMVALKSPVLSPISPQDSQFAPLSTISNKPETLQAPPWYWSPQFAAKNHSTHFSPISYQEPIPELPRQSRFQSLEDQVDPVNLRSVDLLHGFDCGHARKRMFPEKICNYFNKGLCKYGSNCRFFHGQSSERSPSRLDGVDEDQVFSPKSGSLEKLELEIVELLKSRSGQPISIASLPTIYLERYGKVLQAEGYLTESQRHGKVGYTLTNLLARMNNSIRLIDRPHGQHAVILAKDAHMYTETWCERNDLDPMTDQSRKIYLTFPAESTFTKDDVWSYFSIFGSVEDVRLPCLQRRMFGFVIFESADTAKMILGKANPHFICGAQVLVKPYREKTKLMNRKYHEKIEATTQYSPHYLDFEDEPSSLPRGYETSRLFRNPLMEERELALGREGSHLEQLQIARNQMAEESYYKYSMDSLKEAEDFDLPSVEHIRYLLDDLSIGSASD